MRLACFRTARRAFRASKVLLIRVMSTSAEMSLTRGVLGWLRTWPESDPKRGCLAVGEGRMGPSWGDVAYSRAVSSRHRRRVGTLRSGHL